MDKGYSYKQLEVYKASKQLVMDVYQLLKTFPTEERYALCDQIRRAVVSVPSNIAEGMSRYSNKEKVHFLEIAYGSLMETECQLDISHDILYISTEQFEHLETEILSISMMLSALRSSLLAKVVNETRDSKH